MGDSLSSGLQNFSLLDTQQPHGYASVLAKQLGASLTLPLVPYPGAPNVLYLESLYPVPVVGQVQGTLPSPPRDNPSQVPTNISVPGFTVDNALNLAPSIAQGSSSVQQWAYIVLGIPGLPNNPTPTQMQMAQALKPSTVVEWLGNNDALVPALIGQLSALTPIGLFAEDYEKVLDGLKKTGATLIVANIPDVTEVPYFTSAQLLANQTGIPLATVTAELGIGPNDYLRLSALPYADAILHSGQGSLPANCPSPTSSLTSSPVPCVLTAADAATIRLNVACYNSIIQFEAALHGALVVDIHSLVDQIYSHGYVAGGHLLTTTYLGGLFSLDGIHPTDTGYAVIANAFIDAINSHFETSYQHADVNAIFATDSLDQEVLVPYTGPLPTAPNTVPLPAACLATVLSASAGHSSGTILHLTLPISSNR
jgi:hypothetical protein